MKMRKTITWTMITALLTAGLLLCSCDVMITVDRAASDNPYDGFFDQNIVHEIDVRISDADLQDQRENPLEKTKYRVDVTIDGEHLEDVAFSTKGSSSLLFSSQSGSCRYPFKLNFGKYEDDQTYHGLDKLNLSNLYDDPSWMRDRFAYRIMEEAGIDAPLTSYVWLKINGEDAGMYLAIEEVGDSWLERTGHKNSKLYKPEPLMSDANNAGPDDTRIIEEEGLLAFFRTRLKRLGSPADSGSALVYIDDDEESYPDIFDNAETKTSDEDKARLIQSLKILNSPAGWQSAIDPDEVIRYFAAHNFVLSADSYTGLPSHNYYLLEQDGILSVYPWDYNTAFGDTLYDLHPELARDDIVNWAIDEPLFDVDPQERPMWSWIIKDEYSLGRYHEIMDKLVTGYFGSGRFEKEIDVAYKLIEPYQAKDPTAFFTPAESQEGYMDLRSFCMDRASSVRKQLGE